MSALFLYSFATFALQVMLAPTLGAQFAGRSLIIILSPPYIVMALVLGLSFLNGKNLPKISLGRLVALGSVATFLCLLGTKLLVEKMTYDERDVFGKITLNGADNYLVPLVVLACLPHIFYALTFSSLIRKREHGLVSLFRVEMLGAALGIVLTGVAIDFLGWVWPVRFLFVALAAAYLCTPTSSRVEKWVVSALLFTFVAGAAWLEPVTDLRWSARWSVSSPKNILSLTELERKWNSYAKIQKLEVVTPRGSRRFVSLGNGAGTAQLSYNKEGPAPQTISLTHFLKPDRSLVLFCGTGVELLALRDLHPAAKKITGVEINPQLIDMALADDKLGLAAVLAQQQVELVQSDARAYLENSRESFDLILFSWSGATSAFYAGVSVHTAKFAFTKEALRAAWERLSDQGHLVFFGVSKMNILATLRAAIPEEKNWEQKIVLLESQGQVHWKAGWDNFVLYVKRNAVTPAELTVFEEQAKLNRFRVVLAPGVIEPSYQLFHDMLTTRDVAATLQKLTQATGLEFMTVTDDKPFPYEVKSSSSPSEAFTLLHYVLLTGIVSLVGLALILRGTERSSGSTVVFVSLGVAGVLFQIYAIYLLLLLNGNPTWALIFGLGLNLLSSGIASTLVAKFSPSRRTVVLMGALGVLCWGGLYLLVSTQSEFVGTEVVVLVSFLAGILVSLVFPHALSERSQGQSWLAVDCLAAGFVCGAAPLLIEAQGFSIVLFFAMAFVLLALGFLSRERAPSK
mgnify:CR=1 FL=1